MSYRLRLAHLYPEQMNIYGDRGNILTLTQRCAWRGVMVDLLPVGVGDDVDWGAVDIAFFGGGQDSGQALIATTSCSAKGRRCVRRSRMVWCCSRSVAATS